MLLVALLWQVACSGGSSQSQGEDLPGDRPDAGGLGDAPMLADTPGPLDISPDHWRKPDWVADTGGAGGDTGWICPEKTPCDDGDPCTFSDECDSQGVCRGIAYTCDDDDPCTRDVCLGDGDCDFPTRAGHCLIGGECYREGRRNPVNACMECVTAVSTSAWTADDTNPCDDGSLCTLDDVCRAGECVGRPVDCDDGNPCTDDSCDPATGQCVHTDNAAPCDDLDPCSVGDFCEAGVCRRGADENDCDDGNPCTLNGCQPGVGCTAIPLDEGECDDGSVCTTSDRCERGRCVGDPLPCNDANPCTDNICDPLDGCQFIPNTDACDDLNPCTVGDFCANGECRPGQASRDCDDGNPCTDDICVSDPVCDELTGVCIPAGGCVHIPNRAPCEDGDECTGGDRCAQGECVPGSDPPNCDDGNICTFDHCVPGLGCQHDPLDRTCTDNNACTWGDHCVDGLCQPGDQAPCSDGNPCTDDLCDPVTGCRYVANDLDCEDGNPCSLNDSCRFGRCMPGPDRLDCDDGDPCTDDQCLTLIGCYHSFNVAPCEDGNPCSTGDTCSLGVCLTGAGRLECDDRNPCTDDACVDGVGCVFTNNTAPCDDGNPCTVTDLCTEGACVGSGWLECPDLGPCTNEFCEPGTGCNATVVQSFDCRPQIIITYPPRASFLTPPRDLVVTGYVLSPAGDIIVARVNQTPVELDENLNFAYPMRAQHGTNLLTAQCMDEWGAQDRVVQSFVMSTEYKPLDYDDPTSSMVDDSLLVFMNPEVFDDNEEDLDDLAAIIELVVGNFDLNGLIPNPVASGRVWPCSWRVDLGRLAFGKPKVDLSPNSEGLALDVIIDYFYAPVDVDWCFGASGSVSIDRIVLSMVVGLEVGPDDYIDVIVRRMLVEIGGVDVRVGGALGFIVNPIIGFFESSFDEMLEDAARDQLVPLVEDTLEDALNSLLINEEFAIPALLPGMPETSVSLVTRIGSIDTRSQGMTLGMKTAVVAPKHTPYDPPGSIVWNNCLLGGAPDFHFETYIPLQVAAADDLLNQVLFAVYYTGLLELDIGPDELGELLGEDGLSGLPVDISDLAITTSGMLPPTLTSCGAWDDLRLQLGDLFVNARMNLMGLDVDIDLYVSLELRARLELNDTAQGNEIVIRVLGMEFIEIEVARLNDTLLGSENVIGELLGELLVPMITEAVKDLRVGFAIPSIDLSSLAPELGLPPGLSLSIQVEEFFRETGYTVVGGEVR